VKSYSEIVNLKSGAPCLPVMDFYPTYSAYEAMMYEFEANYPDLCEIIELGTLESGRKLFVAHIGDNLNTVEEEPDFLYTSTMHGDELAGFPLMLMLIDHLLCNYEDDPDVKAIVDNINIFINPLANPDGTYRDDDETISNPMRRNANDVDLNRNFPDPDDGNQPDNRPRQDESQMFMDFAMAYDFDMSANFHGGAEVVNYPWDTYAQLPADVTWWEETCHAYADTCQLHSPDGYLESFNDGITNGYDWYEVRGGRQDYMNYFHRCREFTMELSDRKELPASDIPVVWEANRRSLINYMASSINGLRGVVTDCETGAPIVAEVFIPAHDADNSSVFSEAALGNFYRYLDDGTYLVEVRADGYQTQSVQVEIFDKEITYWDVELCADGTSVEDMEETVWQVTQSEDRILVESQSINATELILFDYTGRKINASTNQNYLIKEAEITGTYLLKIVYDDTSFVTPIFIK